MHHELLLKAITHRIIAVSVVTLLLVMLIAFLKEINREDPLRGALELTIALIALCAFAALMAAKFQARKMIVPQSVSQWLDTAANPGRGAGIETHRTLQRSANGRETFQQVLSSMYEQYTRKRDHHTAHALLASNAFHRRLMGGCLDFASARK
jgi:hypothetical protein